MEGKLRVNCRRWSKSGAICLTINENYADNFKVGGQYEIKFDEIKFVRMLRNANNISPS